MSGGDLTMNASTKEPLCACRHALTIHDTAGICRASVAKPNGMVPCGCSQPREAAEAA